MLIKPSCFNYNAETALDNEFQIKPDALTASQVQETALKEFKCLQDKLHEVTVAVKVFQDIVQVSPDAVFPNNWLSFHHDDTNNTSKLVIYPMLSDLRKLERRTDIVEYWQETLGSVAIDYSCHEQQGLFLEGTGSMVLDREFKIAYAAISPRTNHKLFDKFCREFEYTPVSFRAQLPAERDGQMHDIYHTNVMMSVCAGFAVVCLQSIVNAGEREKVLFSLKQCGREVLDITAQQVRTYTRTHVQTYTRTRKSLFLIINFPFLYFHVLVATSFPVFSTTLPVQLG